MFLNLRNIYEFSYCIEQSSPLAPNNQKGIVLDIQQTYQIPSSIMIQINPVQVFQTTS
jgi:hypothetical protein